MSEVRQKDEPQTHLDGYPAALIRMVSRTPQARSCCTARRESNLRGQNHVKRCGRHSKLQPSSYLLLFDMRTAAHTGDNRPTQSETCDRHYQNQSAGLTHTHTLCLGTGSAESHFSC